MQRLISLAVLSITLTIPSPARAEDDAAKAQQFIKGPSANKLPNWYRKSFDGSVRMRGCRMHKLSMDWNRSLMRS
jgi:hypothetical protein